MLGIDQHVHNLYASPGTAWSHVDMTAQAGGPSAAAGLASWVGSGVSLLLSGKVTSGSSGVPGATVSLSGTVSMTTASDANGNYSFAVTAGRPTIKPVAPYCWHGGPTIGAVIRSGQRPLYRRMPS